MQPARRDFLHRGRLPASGSVVLSAKLRFREKDREASFLLGFSDEGKRREKTTDYAALRDVCGADWVYRQLIERLLGASERKHSFPIRVFRAISSDDLFRSNFFCPQFIQDIIVW